MTSEGQQWENWERTRGKGRKHFILRYGVCGFGLAFGCVGAVILTIFFVKSGHPYPWMGFFAAPPVIVFGGYVWGRLFWEIMDAQYLAARAALEQKAAREALSREVQELRKELGR